MLFCPLGGISGAEDSRWAVIPESVIVHGYGVASASSALNKALTDAAEHVLGWGLPKDAEAWRPRRTQVEIGLRKAIGLEALPERAPLNARTLATHDLGDYALENLIFYTRPGFPVAANLYRPKSPVEGRRPALLCPIGHYTTKAPFLCAPRRSRGSGGWGGQSCLLPTVMSALVSGAAQELTH